MSVDIPSDLVPFVHSVIASRLTAWTAGLAAKPAVSL